MKKIISLIAAMVLFCSLIPVATAEDEVYLRLVGGSGRVGDFVEVELNIENAPACSGFEITLQYDNTVLEFDSGESGDISGLFMCSPTTYDGKAAVNCIAGYEGECLSGNRNLATVTFRIIGETSGRFGTPLNVCFKPFYPVDKSQSVFAPEAKHGRVYVGADEVLSTAQVVEIMRHRIGIPTPNEEELDWNGDGQLTIADAVMLLRELN